MPQPRQPAALPETPAVREGSRWIGGRPDPKVFADWFKENVKLHDEMDPDRYVGGVVLISGTEKHKVARSGENGAQVFPEEQRLVHTPYAKVETRVAYFWDYMAKHPDWVGVIEPGPITPPLPESLPPGFFRLVVNKPTGAVNFVCCSMRVRILRADSVRSVEERVGSPRMGIERGVRVEGVPVAEFPAATKMIPVLSRGDEDPFALMKAETGAVGRALGMAGMLVIPGSGVATAEDMIEAQQAQPSEPTLEAGQAAGAPAPDLRAEIEAMIAKLEEEKPEAMAQIREWATERRVVFADLRDTQLRGLHRKLADALAD